MGTTCLRCSTSSTTPSSVSYLRVFQKFKMPQPHTIAVISLLIVALTRLAPAQGSCRYTSYGADTVVNDEGNEIAKKRGGYNVCKKKKKKKKKRGGLKFFKKKKKKKKKSTLHH